MSSCRCAWGAPVCMYYAHCCHACDGWTSERPLWRQTVSERPRVAFEHAINITCDGARTVTEAALLDTSLEYHSDHSLDDREALQQPL